MSSFPDFNESGDMPPGIYAGSIGTVSAHFGVETPRRQQIIERLKRIHSLVISTGHVACGIVEVI